MKRQDSILANFYYQKVPKLPKFQGDKKGSQVGGFFIPPMPTMPAPIQLIGNLVNAFSRKKEKPIKVPSDLEKTIHLNLKDPRKVRMTTGKKMNPNRDLMSGDYVLNEMGEAIKRAKKRGLSLDDAWNMAAIDFQETLLGNRDNEMGHAKDYQGEDNIDRFLNAYQDKMKTADRLKYKDPYLRLQVYNGLGKVYPETEQWYHGFKANSFYGVPVPKTGLDLKRNPLYGKQIIDLRDNVLRKNPEFVKFINSAYGEKMKRNGGLVKYQSRGQVNIPGVTDFKMPTNYSTDRQAVVIPMMQQAAGEEINRRNAATAKRQFVGQGKASTKESEARRIMLNKQNIAGLPNVQMDQFGNTFAINPNMTYEGQPANFMGERQQKSLDHIVGALDAAGYVTGASELGKLGYSALKNLLGKSIKPGIISNSSKVFPKNNLSKTFTTYDGELVTLPSSEKMITSKDFFTKSEIVEMVRRNKELDKRWDDLYEEYEKVDPNMKPIDIFEIRPDLKEEADRLKEFRKKTGSFQDKFLTPELDKYVRQFENDIDVRQFLSNSELKRFAKGLPPHNSVNSMGLDPMEILRMSDGMMEKYDGIPSIPGIYPFNSKNTLKNLTTQFEKGKLNRYGGMITDPRGQWAHPGKNTRIPGDNITMQGVPYPVLAKANNGMTTMMYPGQDYYFPGAEYVDEYPMMRKGGLIKYQVGGQGTCDPGYYYDVTVGKCLPLKATNLPLNTINEDETTTPIEQTSEERRLALGLGADAPTNESLKQGTAGSDSFLKNWYSQRIDDPRYGKVAQQRIVEIPKIQETPTTAADLQKKDAGAYYIRGGKKIYIDPNNPYSRGSSVQTHEKTHEVYDQVPQPNQDNIIKSLIVNEKNWNGDRGSKYNYKYYSDPTEVAARLNQFRKRYNIDPNKSILQKK